MGHYLSCHATEKQIHSIVYSLLVQSVSKTAQIISIILKQI